MQMAPELRLSEPAIEATAASPRTPIETLQSRRAVVRVEEGDEGGEGPPRDGFPPAYVETLGDGPGLIPMDPAPRPDRITVSNIRGSRTIEIPHTTEAGRREAAEQLRSQMEERLLSVKERAAKEQEEHFRTPYELRSPSPTPTHTSFSNMLTRSLHPPSRLSMHSGNDLL